MKKSLLKHVIKEEIVRFLKEPVNESKKYKKGDELHVKLKSGKEFDVVFDSYSSTDGIAFGRIDGETKPFSLNAVVESLNEAVKYKKGDKIRIKPSALKSYQDSIESSDSNWCIPVYTFVRYTKKSDETKFPNIVAIRNGKYEDLPIGDVIPFKGSIKIESINEAKKFNPLEALKYLGKQGYSASKIKFDRELGGAMSFKVDGKVIGRLNAKGELVDLKESVNESGYVDLQRKYGDEKPRPRKYDKEDIYYAIRGQLKRGTISRYDDDLRDKINSYASKFEIPITDDDVDWVLSMLDE